VEKRRLHARSCDEEEERERKKEEKEKKQTKTVVCYCHFVNEPRYPNFFESKSGPNNSVILDVLQRFTFFFSSSLPRSDFVLSVMLTVFTLLVLVSFAFGGMVCSSGYSCVQDPTNANLAWAMKLDGNINGPSVSFFPSL
jgi:hypothetical protein